MIQCNVYLYILIFNKQTLTYEILSIDKDRCVIPHKTLISNIEIHSVLEDIFKHHVDLEPFYTNFVLADIINEDTLSVNYFCLVPYATKIKQGHLLSINYDKISSQTIRLILAKL